MGWGGGGTTIKWAQPRKRSTVGPAVRCCSHCYSKSDGAAAAAAARGASIPASHACQQHSGCCAAAPLHRFACRSPQHGAWTGRTQSCTHLSEGLLFFGRRWLCFLVDLRSKA